ncbi:MAG: hypothetical protein WCL18_06250 [bacterium]
MHRETYWADICRKTDLLQLKNHLRNLKAQEPKYRELFNKVTRIANKAKGKNPVAMLNGISETFQSLQQTQT